MGTKEIRTETMIIYPVSKHRFLPGEGERGRQGGSLQAFHTLIPVKQSLPQGQISVTT